MTTQKRNEKIDETLETIRKMIDTIQYGTVTLVIQDGHIVQIDKNEKIRLKK